MSEKIYKALAATTALVSHTAHLEKENELLVQGAANQARIIRELREELESIRAELDLARYNVEFLKRQGRRTRFKHREQIKRLKAAHVPPIITIAPEADTELMRAWVNRFAF